MDAIRDFPKPAKKALGDALLDLQHGAQIGMPMSRPMPSVAPGAYELRVRDRSGIYRTFYATKTGSDLLVFHAFVKKTQKTPAHEIELARRRFKEMLEWQKEK
jgi:phage-related protein